MFSKLQTWLKKKQNNLKKEKELVNAKRFYTLIKSGAEFIKFVQNDLRNKENGMNRTERRRFQKELEEKGVLSPEVVNYYQQKIDWILKECDKRMTSLKNQK